MKRIQKPIGVIVWTIFSIISYGIMPFIGNFYAGNKIFMFGVMALPYNGSVSVLYDQNGEPLTIFIVVTLFFCFFTVGSAIWTAIGDNEGRIVFLAFVTFNVLWWTFVILLFISGVETRDPIFFEMATSLIFPFIWLGVLWWYFTRPEVVRYFKRDQEVDIK